MRVTVLIAVGIAGVGFIWLYPPTRAIERQWQIVSIDWTENSSDTEVPHEPDEATDTWDAGPEWRWNLPAERGHLHNPLIMQEVDGPRLVGELGIWAGVVFIAATFGYRQSAKHSRLIVAAVKESALLIAGFTIARTLLAGCIILAHGGERADQLLSGDQYLIFYYSWAYGWPVTFAFGAWITAAYIGWLRRTKYNQYRASPGLDWMREISPWPAEKWFGGPAEPGRTPDHGGRE